MKPLHVGLLVFGAAVAGGLAVRMTQEPPAVSVTAPVVAAKPVVVAPKSAPEPVVVAQPEPEPMPTAAPAAKWRPSPFPKVVVAAAKPPMTIAPAPYSEPPHASAPQHQATLPEGLPVAIRLKQSLTMEHSAGGDTFEAVLAQPLIADGFVVAEAGARVTGHVVNARMAGRVSDVSRIELALSTVQTADGQRVPVITEPWSRQDDLPVETLIRFRLASRVTITERPL